MKNEPKGFIGKVPYSVFFCFLFLYFAYGLAKHDPAFWGPPALF